MIPFEDKMVGIGIGVVVCAILGFIIYIIAKKESAKNEERVKTLTEEQKQTLINAPVTPFSNYGGGVIVKALLYEINTKSQSKAKIVVLYYNTYYPNSLYKIQWMDITIPAKTLEEHQLRQGDYVNMKIDQNGGKFVF